MNISYYHLYNGVPFDHQFPIMALAIQDQRHHLIYLAHPIFNKLDETTLFRSLKLLKHYILYISSFIKLIINKYIFFIYYCVTYIKYVFLIQKSVCLFNLYYWWIYYFGQPTRCVTCSFCFCRISLLFF